MNQVAMRLDVSAKSIQRYRKQGLVCHYLFADDGTKILMCFEDALERFARGHRGQIEKAASFTRVDDGISNEIISKARALRENNHLSLNETAKRLAKEYGRAHETIRMLLRRNDRKAEAPVFDDRGPLDEREIRFIERAWRWGIKPARLAKYLGKTKPTVHRAVNRRRRDLLRSLQLHFITLPTFELPDAPSVILSAPQVITGLHKGLAIGDAISLITAAHDAPPVGEDVEDALVAGYNFLKMRAAKAITALGDWPTSKSLDRIETDLRWANLLRRRLIALGFPAALRCIEQNRHRSLRHEPGEQIVILAHLAARVVAQTVEGLDPSRGQRLERVTAQAMDRALATTLAPGRETRAAARHRPGSVALDRTIIPPSPWEAWLNPRRDLELLLPELKDRTRLALVRRYGLAGEPPLTCKAIAQQMNMTAAGAARLLQQAGNDVRRIAGALETKKKGS